MMPDRIHTNSNNACFPPVISYFIALADTKHTQVAMAVIHVAERYLISSSDMASAYRCTFVGFLCFSP
jgi:hypothetical protein